MTIKACIYIYIYYLQEVTSLTDQLDEAANYIKKLQTSLEKMKEKKHSLIGTERANMMSSTGPTTSSSGVPMGVKSPQIEIRQMGLALEIVLITGLDFQFMFNEIIRALHEQGADIVNASFSVVEDTVFHTIHSQVSKTHFKLVLSSFFRFLTPITYCVCANVHVCV